MVARALNLELVGTHRLAKSPTAGPPCPPTKFLTGGCATFFLGSTMIIRVFFIFLVCIFSSSAFSQSPVAIIESIESESDDFESMDMLYPEDAIELGSTGTVVLGYFSSCIQETVKGGSIIIGENQSIIDKGVVVRANTNCDGGNIRLSAKQSSKSGAIVFRNKKKKTPRPELVVYSLSPIFLITNNQINPDVSLIISRLDSSSPRIRIAGLRESVDLSKLKIKLVEGGLYRAKLGKKSLVFKVDITASSGPASIISRLIRM